MRYAFETIEKCNMCGVDASTARVLGKRMNRSQGARPTGKVGIATTVVKCRNCQLIFANPLPIPASISQHYDTPPESYWKPAYFQVDADYFMPQIDKFFALYRKREGLTALDAGAGLGKCMIALSRRGFETYGFEPSESFYNAALEKMSISRARLQLASFEEAEYPADSLDFVNFGAVLEHLYDPSTSILRSLKWLKPGGLTHIEVPSSAWLTNKIYNLVYRLQGLDYVSNISPMHPPFHLYEFGLKSFQEHARRHSYEIAAHQFMVAETFLPRVLNPIVRPWMAKTNSGMQLDIWLRKSSGSKD